MIGQAVRALDTLILCDLAPLHETCFSQSRKGAKIKVTR